MKGTLLLLALLVIGELGFQTTEACIPLIQSYLGIVSGSRILMGSQLWKFDATAKEKVAFEKLQDCYNKEGLKSKLLEPQVMLSLLFSKECQEYYGKELLTKIESLFPKSPEQVRR